MPVKSKGKDLSGEMTLLGKTRGELLKEEWCEGAIERVSGGRKVVIEALKAGAKDAFQKFGISHGNHLDIGTGTGYSFNFMEPGSNVTSIERSEELVRLLSGVFPGISIVRGSVLEMGFAGSSFGTAGGFASLDWVPSEELPRAVREIYRVLKPGGKFYHVMDVGPSRTSQSSSEVEERVLATRLPLYEQEALYRDVMHGVFRDRLTDALKRMGFIEVTATDITGQAKAKREGRHNECNPLADAYIYNKGLGPVGLGTGMPSEVLERATFSIVVAKKPFNPLGQK